MDTIKYLTPDETKELYEVIKNEPCLYQLRNIAIFHLAKYCALRVSEIGLLKIGHYSPNSQEIYCIRQKNSSNNTLRLKYDKDVLYYLNLYLHERKNMNTKNTFLFLSQRGTPIGRKMLDRLMKKYCEKTSIPREKWHFHVLKHTRAVELANRGLDVKDLQFWLGHKKIENTMIYMQFTTLQQEAMYEKMKGYIENEKKTSTKNRNKK